MTEITWLTTWLRSLAWDILAEITWLRSLGWDILVEITCLRPLGWDILIETTWLGSPGTQEAPGRHPGGTQEASRGTQRHPRRHPGGTQEAPWRQNVLKHVFSLATVARPSVSRRRERPNPHHLPRLRTNVVQHSEGELTYHHWALTPDRRNPCS